MATSGLLMFVVDRPTPTIRMHPVHRLFGLVLIGAALSHIQLSSREISAHLKERSAAIAAAVLAIALVSTITLKPVGAAGTTMGREHCDQPCTGANSTSVPKKEAAIRRNLSLR